MNSAAILNALSNISPEYIREAAQWDAMPGETDFAAKRRGTRLILIAAAALCALLLGAAAVLKSSYLTQWFGSRGENEQFSEQLAPISSGSTGIVADDDMVKIEAIGAVRSDNMVSFSFIVTLKQLDSSLVDSGYPTMGGYLFREVQPDVSVTAVRNIGHYWPSTVPDLEDNQFMHIQTVVVEDGTQSLTVNLDSIGYYSTYLAAGGASDSFVAYIENDWRWTFILSEASEATHCYTISKEAEINGITCHISKLELSPLFCTVTLSVKDWIPVQRYPDGSIYCNGQAYSPDDAAYAELYATYQQQAAFCDPQKADLAVTLADGTQVNAYARVTNITENAPDLDANGVPIDTGGEFVAEFYFDIPLDTDEIQQIVWHGIVVYQQ